MILQLSKTEYLSHRYKLFSAYGQNKDLVYVKDPVYDIFNHGGNDTPINFIRWSNISKQQRNFSYFANIQIVRQSLITQINKQ